MTSRIVVTLDRDERRGLDRLAEMNLRDPRAQLRYMLREAIVKEGVLESYQARQLAPQQAQGGAQLAQAAQGGAR